MKSFHTRVLEVLKVLPRVVETVRAEGMFNEKLIQCASALRPGQTLPFQESTGPLGDCVLVVPGRPGHTR